MASALVKMEMKTENSLTDLTAKDATTSIENTNDSLEDSKNKDGVRVVSEIINEIIENDSIIDTLQTAETGNIVECIGTKSDFPDDLNRLFLPFHCQLCNIIVNSPSISMLHYTSKLHQRRVLEWMMRNAPHNPWYLEHASRSLKYNTMSVAELNMLFCSVCQVQLTSSAHLNQHYSGQKHIRAEQNAKKSKADASVALDLHCKTCNIYLAGKVDVISHLRGKHHHRKLDSLRSMDKIGKQGNDLTKEAVQQYYCDTCKMNCKCEFMFKRHINGKKHKLRLDSTIYLTKQ